MNQTNKDQLDHRIHSYFVEQLKKEFKDDISLVADKLDRIIRENTIKDVRYLIRQEINKAKSN